jgi:mono/diheme cytochrome c family protein
MRTLITITAVLALGSVCFGQDTQTKIKKVPIEYTSPGSGPEMFKAYCASCHGPDGAGNGPAAAALKKAPTNLTLLSRRNGGKFPGIEVENTIQGSLEDVSHGSRDMPIWGDIFKSVSPNNSAVTIRIAVLNDYIKTLQK